MASGVYAIPTIEFEGRARRDEHDADRGRSAAPAGPRPRQAIERAIDLFAAEIGLDPAEVRRRNFIPTDAFPHTTASGATYDSGDYEGALDLALDAAGYDELRAEQRRRREQGATRQLGIGVASYVEITNGRRRDRVRRGRDHARTAARSSAPARSPTARATRRRSR